MNEDQLKVKNRFNNAYKVYLDIKKRYEEALEENISELEVEFMIYQNNEIEAIN